MFLDKIDESLFDFANLANRPEQILLSREQQPKPLSDDRERIIRAREAAEALFKPNPSGETPPMPGTAPADQAVRKPRVLQIVSPPVSVQRTDSERSVTPPPPAREIARSQFGRIRTGYSTA